MRENFLYLGRDNEQRAEKFASSVEETFEQLLESPNIGSPRQSPNSRVHSLRQWPVRDFRNYLIFYRAFASGNGLEVLRALHRSRDAQAHLEAAVDEPDPA